jgi:general secretion pathway protein G
MKGGLTMKRTCSERSESNGFTLVEIMVVVIIIGMLAAMVVPRLIGRTLEAAKEIAKADIAAIDTALGMYDADNQCLPDNNQGLQALMTKPSMPPIPKKWSGPYLKKSPTDPWGQPYRYHCPGRDNKDCDIWSIGPDGREGSEDDIKSWEIK